MRPLRSLHPENYPVLLIVTHFEIEITYEGMFCNHFMSNKKNRGQLCWSAVMYYLVFASIIYECTIQ